MTSIRLLKSLSTKDLQARFLATFGTPTLSRNRPWLIKRLRNAPRVQAPAPKRDAPPAPAVESDHAPEISSGAADQLRASASAVVIPAVGSEIRRSWRGQELVVTVQADGFLLNGTVYRSLSAAATALCGGNRNGLVFFGLKPRPTTPAPANRAAP